MQDLKEVTQDFHYENYRAQRLKTPPGGSPKSDRKRYNIWDLYSGEEMHFNRTMISSSK